MNSLSQRQQQNPQTQKTKLKNALLPVQRRDFRYASSYNREKKNFQLHYGIVLRKWWNHIKGKLGIFIYCVIVSNRLSWKSALQNWFDFWAWRPTTGTKSFSLFMYTHTHMHTSPYAHMPIFVDMHKGLLKNYWSWSTSTVNFDVWSIGQILESGENWEVFFSTSMYMYGLLIYPKFWNEKLSFFTFRLLFLLLSHDLTFVSSGFLQVFVTR